MRDPRLRHLSVCLLAAGLLAGPAAAAVLVNADHETQGVSAPRWLAFSPGDEHLYVVNGAGNDGVSVYERVSTPGPSFGDLLFVASYSGDAPCGNNVLKGATSVVVSPDGEHVYVTSRPNGNSHILTAWSRDTGTGELDCIQQFNDKVNLRRPTGLSISSDGTTVYVATSTAKQERVTAFSRDTGTGLLTFLQSIRDGIGAQALAGPKATAVGPGDNHVYVVAEGDDAVTRFLRNVAGSLSSPVEIVDNQGGADGLLNAAHLVLSPDGAHLYTAASGEAEIGIFERDGGNGTLSFAGVAADASLQGVSGLAASPDGAFIYAASPGSSALGVFGRDLASGSLSFAEAITDPGNLDGATFVVASADGECVYVAAETASSVEAYCFGDQDFGDADAPYATLAADGGARHTPDDGTFLGDDTPDAEADGQPSASADGDDLANFDDEDGLAPLAQPILAGQINSLDLTGDGLVDAWIDFNGDGDWDDAGEQVVTGATLPATPTFTAPAVTLDGFSVARLRARPTGSAPLGPTGGAGAGEVEDHRIELSSDSFQVTVTPAGNGSGTVTSSPPGIDCGGNCIAPFAEGIDVTLTAVAATGSDFDGWSGPDAGECAGDTCTFTDLAAAKEVTATFTLQQFTLTTSIEAGNGTIDDVAGTGILCGTGGSDCDEVYDYGTEVQLTAVADPGWTFVGWSGACTNVVGDCIVTITEATAVSASFGESVFLLTVDPEGGTGTGTVRITDNSDDSFVDCRPELPADPDCTGFYLEDASLTLTALPDGDSLFLGWSDDCSGTLPCDLTMSADRTVTAEFDLTVDLRVVVADMQNTGPDDGAAIQWTAVVSNAGSIDPTGTAQVTSFLPVFNVTVDSWSCAASGTTCPNDTGSGNLDETVSLPVGASLTYTFFGTAPDPARNGFFTTVTVTGPDTEGAGVGLDNTDTGFFGYYILFKDDFELNDFSRWSLQQPPVP
jgi:6-phosphogluconolactonase (cycloisomerase 2 family)